MMKEPADYYSAGQKNIKPCVGRCTVGLNFDRSASIRKILC